MKLDYNIIWIEDKFSDRDDSDGEIFYGIKSQIETFLGHQFFNIDKFDTAADFENFATIFDGAKEYDLIITDLSLNNGTTGTQVIDYVRDKKQNSTEILFYSANTKFRDQKLINSNRITYFQLTGDYKDLGDAIENLIKLTIQKFQHIVAMRGMIMHETSSLDVIITELANKILGKEGNNNIDFKIIKNAFLTSIQSNAKEKYDKATDGKIKDILKDNLIFNISEKINIIDSFINECNNKGINIDNFTNDYKKEVNTIRNNFAHATLEVDAITGTQYFKGNRHLS